MIPPAPKNTRQITEHICTIWNPRTKTVRAEYARDGQRTITSPFEEECCALFTLLCDGEDGLEGIITQEEFLRADAVYADMDAVGHGRGVKPATPDEWERTPFPRGPKPRRRRTKWTDTETGKQINVYADTKRRFSFQRPHREEDE